MLLTNHVLSGALIGALARRPLPAFAAGVASHFALDAVPHWGDWGSRRRYLRVAVADGLISLGVAGAVTAISPADRRAGRGGGHGRGGAARPRQADRHVARLVALPAGGHPVPRSHPGRGAGPGAL